MTAVVEVKDVSRRFGAVSALDAFNLEVAAGSILGLIGPNGAGKTTLLRALLGLTRYRGDIAVFGLDPMRQREKLMREVCFIADTAVLPGWMRVYSLLMSLRWGWISCFANASSSKFWRITITVNALLLFPLTRSRKSKISLPTWCSWTRAAYCCRSQQRISRSNMSSCMPWEIRSAGPGKSPT